MEMHRYLSGASRYSYCTLSLLVILGFSYNLCSFQSGIGEDLVHNSSYISSYCWFSLLDIALRLVSMMGGLFLSLSLWLESDVCACSVPSAFGLRVFIMSLLRIVISRARFGVLFIVF
jgi:hypothetical protein